MATPYFDERLVQSLPLPLARMYRRASNAKTALERHHAAYYLWEAGLKLTTSVAIAEYAAFGQHDTDIDVTLQNLARPSTGHWWQMLRTLLPWLSQRGDQACGRTEQFLLGNMHSDLPRTAGLDAALRESLDGRGGPQSTVRVSDLFDRLIRYRNQELGHGASGQRSRSFYERMGETLTMGLAEIFGRLDPLAGRRLIYVAEIRRQARGDWLVERYELAGETPRRLEPWTVPQEATDKLPNPERVYLQEPAPELVEAGSFILRSLHPLILYDTNLDEVFFLNSRRGKREVEYLCYSTGQVVKREELGVAQRELLAQVIGESVDNQKVGAWSLRTQAEEAGLPAETEPLANTIAEFELLTEIGRGGMGVVYRAWQPSLGRQVALKCLLQAGDPRAEARFAREIRALGRVEHPHLIKIFTSGSVGSQWFFTMEMVDGAPLAEISDRLRAKKTSPAEMTMDAWRATIREVRHELRAKEKPIGDDTDRTEAIVQAQAVRSSSDSVAAMASQSYVMHLAELLRQVAEAAHALHESQIIHRDIKPGNIMVTGDGAVAVLMDLGLAQLVDDDAQGRLTRTRQFVGTLRYASPEQVLAVDRVDRRSDIYSLGATLWELLTLQPLYEATEEMSTLELMQRIESRAAGTTRRFNTAVPMDLEAIVARCLEKDPARRYATAAELAADLQRFLNGQPVQARPIGMVERTWRWVKGRPREAALVIASSLALITLGTTLITQRMLAREQAFTRQLDQANQATERQRVEAESQYRQALAAVNSIFSLVSQGELSSQPALQPVRSKLLEYYQQYIQQRQNDPALQAELADVYERMATITKAIGKKQEALHYYEHAERTYTQLLSRDGDSILHRDQLAMVRIAQAILLQDFRELEQADQKLKQAREALDKLTEEAPEQVELPQHLAEAYHNLGILYDAMNRRQESLGFFAQGLAIRERLQGTDSSRSLRRDLARSHGYIGDVQLDLGMPEQSLASYRQAEAIRRQLADEDPRDTEARFQLARSFRNTGNFYDREGQLTQAVKEYAQARRYSEELVRERTAVTEYKSDLTDFCCCLAELLIDDGRLEEAMEPLERASFLAKQLLDNNPEDVTASSFSARCQVCLARAHAATDIPRAQTALTTAEKILIAADKQLAFIDEYLLAVIAALRGKLEPDSATAPGDALTHLSRAIELGFRNRHKLKRDAAFRDLQDGVEWKALTAKLP